MLFPVCCLMAGVRRLELSVCVWPFLVTALAIMLAVDPSAHSFHWMAPVGVGLFCVQMAVAARSEFPRNTPAEQSRSSLEGNVPSRGILIGIWVAGLGFAAALMVAFNPPSAL